MFPTETEKNSANNLCMILLLLDDLILGQKQRRHERGDTLQAYLHHVAAGSVERR